MKDVIKFWLSILAPQITTEDGTSEQPEAGFTLWRALAILLTFYGAQFMTTIMVVVLLTFPAGDPTLQDNMIALLFGVVVSGWLMIAVSRRVLGQDLYDGSVTGGAWKIGAGKDIAAGSGVGAILGLALPILSYLVFPPLEEVAHPLLWLSQLSGFPAVLAALVIALLVPVFEELLFRGVLFAALTRSAGKFVGGLITTVVFAAAHYPVIAVYWPSTIAFLGIGTVALLIRISTRAIGPAIALHATYNGVLVAALFLSIE